MAKRKLNNELMQQVNLKELREGPNSTNMQFGFLNPKILTWIIIAYRLSAESLFLLIHPLTQDCIINADFALSLSNKIPLHHLCSFNIETSTIFNSEF